jgi:hypothetical protein
VINRWAFCATERSTARRVLQARRTLEATLRQRAAADRATAAGDVERAERLLGAAQPRLLPGSVPGSRAHTKRLVDDGMALITQYGNPTFWVTMTANPAWPEIQEALITGSDGRKQHASERPEVVVSAILRVALPFRHPLA